MKYEPINLELLQFALQKRISKKILSDFQLDVSYIIDELGQDICINLNTLISSEKLQEDKILEIYPETLFQYFKLKYFPNFLKRKFPVKFKMYSATFKRYVLYPKLSKYLKNTENIEYYTYETLYDEEIT